MTFEDRNIIIPTYQLYYVFLMLFKKCPGIRLIKCRENDFGKMLKHNIFNLFLDAFSYNIIPTVTIFLLYSFDVSVLKG